MKEIRVLLVEDEDTDAEAIHRQLRRSTEPGFEVTWVQTLVEAHQQLELGLHDVVLLDLSLPDAVGLETLRSVHGVAADVPIVVLTGRHDADLVSASLREGAQDYLPKGNLEPLERALRYAIERKQSEVERHRIESRLREVQKLESLGVLAGGVAHDFNNILTSILGYASLCTADAPEGSLLATRLARIEDAATRAGQLCSQLLAYSGRGRFVVGPVDLSNLVRETVDIVRMSVSKKVNVDCSAVDDVPQIEASDSQIRQVVMNLLTNASDALGDGSGSVTIQTRTLVLEEERAPHGFFGEPLPSGRYAVVEVSDSGVGMDEETIHRMFNPFYSTKGSGRGLGLSAVLGIVRSHDASIEVESELGEGTVVRVLFPTIAAESEIPAPIAEEPELPAAPPPTGPTTGTVLVVEDELEIQAIVQDTLESLGLRVLVASNGAEGLETFMEQIDEISVVLLDLTMPRMNGDEVYREIARVRPSVPVILTSGYSEQDVIAKVGDPNFSAFLKKPFSVTQLQDSCLRALELSRRDAAQEKAI